MLSNLSLILTTKSILSIFIDKHATLIYGKNIFQLDLLNKTTCGFMSSFQNISFLPLLVIYLKKNITNKKQSNCKSPIF